MSRRFLSVLLSLTLAVAGSVVVIAAPAQAATGWPQDVSDVGNDYIQSTPNGGVVSANCTSAQTAVKTFTALGVIATHVPQRTDGSYVKSCYSQGAVGKDGTVFGIADDGSTKSAAVAYRGNTQLWEKRFLQYCSSLGRSVERVVSQMVVGSDGFLYVTTLTYQCFNGHYLSKVNPNTGQVILEKKVSTFTTSFIGATTKGLVSQDSAGVIRYIGYDGNDFAVPVTASGWVRSIDMSARAFTTTNESGSGCLSQTSLRMYTAGNATPFKFSLGACWYIDSVQATSANGVAALGRNPSGQPVLLSYTPNGSGFTGRSIVLLETDDYRNFKQIGSYYQTYLPAYINTDINGNILLVRGYNWQDGDKVLMGWQFMLHAPDLKVLSQYDTNAFDFKPTTRYARGMSWAMSKDQLYITVGYCTESNQNSCGAHSVKLYAARLARLGMDYPRGSVLGVKPVGFTCKPVQFVGTRGSEEDPFAYEGLGKGLQHVKDQLIAGGLTNMEVTALPYPAIPVRFTEVSYPTDYGESVKAGVDALTGSLLQINRDCPQARLFLGGYSQGAQVIGDTLPFLPTAVQNQIKAVVLFGDPLFNPALTTINKGTHSTNYGIWSEPFGPGGLPARQFPSGMVNKAASYCISGDVICNLTPSNLVYCRNNPELCPHTIYAPS